MLSNKWQFRKTDVDNLLTYADSRANILLYGPNGSGKTTFVRDCLGVFGLDLPLIYVDAVELYSEKLICIFISGQIGRVLEKMASELGIPKAIGKKLTFRSQKNFPGLLQGMQNLRYSLQNLR